MKDSRNVEHYRLESSEIDADGAVIIRLTGWEHHSGRYGAIRRYRPDSPDHDFWRWVVAHKDRWPDSFSEADLPIIRQEYESDVV